MALLLMPIFVVLSLVGGLCEQMGLSFIQLLALTLLVAFLQAIDQAFFTPLIEERGLTFAIALLTMSLFYFMLGSALWYLSSLLLTKLPLVIASIVILILTAYACRSALRELEQPARRLRQLKAGMDRADIESLLGAPHNCYADSDGVMKLGFQQIFDTYEVTISLKPDGTAGQISREKLYPFPSRDSVMPSEPSPRNGTH